MVRGRVGVVQQGGAAREPRPFWRSTRLIGHLGEREREGQEGQGLSEEDESEGGDPAH